MHIISIGTCECGRRGTLGNARCGFCEESPPAVAPVAIPRPMTVARAIDLLLAELIADDIAAPLSQRFTLATICADLCRLAGESVPAPVLAALDELAHAPVRRVETHREPAHHAAD